MGLALVGPVAVTGQGDRRTEEMIMVLKVELYPAPFARTPSGGYDDTRFEAPAVRVSGTITHRLREYTVDMTYLWMEEYGERYWICSMDRGNHICSDQGTLVRRGTPTRVNLESVIFETIEEFIASNRHWERESEILAYRRQISIAEAERANIQRMLDTGDANLRRWLAAIEARS